jgi:hypothetical protein
MNGMTYECWQLERVLHVVSLYTCQLIYLSLHQMSCKEDTKCFFKKEIKGYRHIAARIVTARGMRMNFSVFLG